MTTFDPTATVIILPPPPATGPKLTYEIGDECWLYAGCYVDGEPIMSKGTVVFWVDLPAFVQRQYMIHMANPEWIIMETRDALMMAPTQDAGLPFTRTRFDRERAARGDTNPSQIGPQ